MPSTTWAQRNGGDYPAAAASHRQALAQFRDMGIHHGQAEALNRLGDVLSLGPATREARDSHAEALTIARQIGMPLEEARALEGIGNAELREGSHNAGLVIPVIGTHRLSGPRSSRRRAHPGSPPPARHIADLTERAREITWNSTDESLTVSQPQRSRQVTASQTTKDQHLRREPIRNV
jgi:hypothetical protein